ncbi:RNA polymerase, sigma-24 subunit, ECF subfamily [Catenulispora acidiphila DSM 44928]|uniref:RNA polymerase, sigma-24 subunit, ECF subfamily n=1 Tax=Catenulispora acidiphila (strain DSM 44928 / JCM 14897 / NBRC 102108 / NRRL B-24433 / ID139908) TaxID=479433 RepID=C7QEU1_CATAD|nr:sigma-70 family RNA polymerase sigma factor [Catenulispora acidiphila]ACU72861.1 RNA polymerase, sigma-24 subunit, ECF subfamily [Catenulispora acidiphila DSM 44928]
MAAALNGCCGNPIPNRFRTFPVGGTQESPDPGSGLGSGERFEGQVRELARPMGEQAYRILGDRSLAEEVVQEALLQMWLHRDGFDSARGSLGGWALAIVRHVAVDRVRSEQAAARREALFAVRHAATPYDEVVDAVERVQDYARIRTLLDDLTAVQREAIRLVYFDNLSAAQAAERLGIPVPTLRTRLRDARQALELILGS